MIYTAETLWTKTLNSLSESLTAPQFNTWLKPLQALSFCTEPEPVLVLGSPHRAKLNATQAQFGNLLNQTVSSLIGQDALVHIKIIESSSQVNQTLTPYAQDLSAVTADPKLNQTKKLSHDAQLNRELTFAHLVVGKSNEMAKAAALQIAANPGHSYSPFFIYGGVGLGKTHLMQAIGNDILQRNPHAKIRYIHANDYVADVVRAYKDKTFDSFKAYYEALDVLLIDDIQFIAEKRRTQEEFFYAFEHFISRNKQIVLTSDTFPRALSDMDERLISRFNSGLTLLIEPPELEMRVAILNEKAQQRHTALSDEVAFYIAKHLHENVRELEGALKKLLAYCQFTKRPVNLASAREALKDIISASNTQITVEKIQQAVAEFYKIKVAEMYAKKRTANIAIPRQIAMFLAKELTQKSLPEIGELFGGRDHTTVLYAVRKINDQRGVDSKLTHDLRVIEQLIKG